MKRRELYTEKHELYNKIIFKQYESRIWWLSIKIFNTINSRTYKFVEVRRTERESVVVIDDIIGVTSLFGIVSEMSKSTFIQGNISQVLPKTVSKCFSKLFISASKTY